MTDAEMVNLLIAACVLICTEVAALTLLVMWSARRLLRIIRDMHLRLERLEARRGDHTDADWWKSGDTHGDDR